MGKPRGARGRRSSAVTKKVLGQADTERSAWEDGESQLALRKAAFSFRRLRC